MPRKECVCGASIGSKSCLCKTCIGLYGTDRNKWDVWLKEMVSSHQREWDAQRKHDELELLEETTIIDEAERWTFTEAYQNIIDAGKLDPEMEWEEFREFCND